MVRPLMMGSILVAIQSVYESHHGNTTSLPFYPGPIFVIASEAWRSSV